MKVVRNCAATGVTTCHPASLHLHGRLPLASQPALLFVHVQQAIPSNCSSTTPHITPCDCPAVCPRPPHDVLEIGELAGGAHHAHVVHLAQPLKRLVPLGAAVCACAAGRARAESTRDADRGGANPRQGQQGRRLAAEPACTGRHARRRPHLVCRRPAARRPCK